MEAKQAEQLCRDDEGSRPEISIHRIAVGGSVGGLIFAAGSCVIFIVGIPMLRWFLLASLAVGAAVFAVLWFWHKKKPVEITEIGDVRDGNN